MGLISPSAAGLSNALFAKTRRRVLALLFGNPDRSYFANEVVRLAQSGIGAVHRELATLEAAGLVTATRIGNQKHYQANRASPIFEELRGIVIKTFGVVEVLREMLAPLVPKLRTAFVFGSVAKGSDKASSDIDLMLIGDDIAYTDLFSVVTKAEQRLGRKVNPMIHSPADLQKRIHDGEAFAVRVLAQPKLFVIGSENDLPKPRKSRQGKAASV